uniref:Uncharacterized protein n=1 Tax=Arundo donax TaxID=35708 RepID=A0A0A9FTE7_ARUDO
MSYCEFWLCTWVVERIAHSKRKREKKEMTDEVFQLICALNSSSVL